MFQIAETCVKEKTMIAKSSSFYTISYDTGILGAFLCLVCEGSPFLRMRDILQSDSLLWGKDMMLITLP